MPSSISMEIEFVLNELRGVMESVEIELSKALPNKKALESDLQRTLMLLLRLKEYLRVYIQNLENTLFLRFFQGIQELSTKQQRGVQVTPGELFDFLSSLTLKVPKVPEKEIEHTSSIIELTLTVMNYAVDRVPPEYLKEKIRGTLRDLHTLLARIEADYGFKPSPLSLAFELVSITKNRWGFGERWVVAMCYLSALDIALNRVFKLLELEGEAEKIQFKDKATKVLEALGRRGFDAGVLLKKLPDDLWDLRNKIVHAGYEPSDKELDIITGAVKELLRLLAQL